MTRICHFIFYYLPDFYLHWISCLIHEASVELWIYVYFPGRRSYSGEFINIGAAGGHREARETGGVSGEASSPSGAEKWTLNSLWTRVLYCMASGGPPSPRASPITLHHPHEWWGLGAGGDRCCPGCLSPHEASSTMGFHGGLPPWAGGDAPLHGHYKERDLTLLISQIYISASVSWTRN